jgi:hypothetical protein
MAYRRKPDTVDAWQYDSNGTPPSWLQARINECTVGNGYIIFPTANGPGGVSDGDYILCNIVTGDLEGCPQSEFSARWESIP